LVYGKGGIQFYTVISFLGKIETYIVREAVGTGDATIPETTGIFLTSDYKNKFLKE
jgi:hypothetical protein